MISFQGLEKPQDRLWTERNWTPLFVLIALLVNALHVWTLRWHLEPDGISYLDIAWAYARGNWHHAINAFWSPLFSWILGGAFCVMDADRFSQLNILHTVNFAAFVLATATFALLVHEIQKWQSCLHTPDGTEPLLPGEFSLASYAMFIYASRFVLSPFIDQPDIIVEALVFLDTALLVRIARGDRRVRAFLALGGVLGVGYLAKTVMFPLALVFLVAAFLASGGTRRMIGRTLMAGTLFASVAAPWIVVLSQKEGHPTFGSAGRIAYFVYSHDLEPVDLMTGNFPDGAPVHPIQSALNSPPVLLFPTAYGTFPPWYDPTYYYAGVVNRLTFRGQFLILTKSFSACLQLASASKGPLIGLFILVLFSGLRRYSREFLKRFPIWLPSCVALMAYGLVEFSTRLVEPFIIVFWVALLSAVHTPITQEARRMVSSVILLIVLVLCIPVIQAPASDIRALRTPPERRDKSCGPQWKVAKGLRAMGLAEGNRVAIIGKHQDQTECWAELDGLTIIGEIPVEGANSFWTAPADVQARVLGIFASAGAKAVVTYEMPASGKLTGWQGMDGTPYYARFLGNGLHGNAANQLQASPK